MVEHWPEVASQAHALFECKGGDRRGGSLVDQGLQRVLAEASEEGNFTSLMRTSKPALRAAASEVPNAGWAKVLAAGDDLAALGVSASRMATLVGIETSKLARTLPETAERRDGADPAASPMSPEDFDKVLAGEQDAFAESLFHTLDGLLHTSVYTPLVSYGTQFATDQAVAALPPHSEVEGWASSSDHVLAAQAHEADLERSSHDDLLRRFRGADIEVNLDDFPIEARNELSSRTVEGTGQTLAQLHRQHHGCRLRTFADARGRLYARRPDALGFSDGIRHGGPATDPTFLGIAETYDTTVSCRDRRTGGVKTFHPDGRVDRSRLRGGLEFDCTFTSSGEIGHVTAASQPFSASAYLLDAMDCAFIALVDQLNAKEKCAGRTVAGERARVADTFASSAKCKIFYHNWSRDGQFKHSVGAQTDLRSAQYVALNLARDVEYFAPDALLKARPFARDAGSRLFGLTCGFTDLPLPPLRDHELAFYEGMREGGVLGVAADTYALYLSLGGMAGGGGLAATGVGAPIGVAAFAVSAAGAATAGAAILGHTAEMREAKKLFIKWQWEEEIQAYLRAPQVAVDRPSLSKKNGGYFGTTKFLKISSGTCT